VRNRPFTIAVVVLAALWLLTSAPAALASGGEGEDSGSLMELKVGTSFWTIVVFIVLLLVLAKFAWPPLVQALDARQNRIQTDLTGAERSRQEAEAVLAEYKEKLREAQAEARRQIDDARNEAAKQVEQILAKGREDAEALVTQAKERIGQETDRALVQLYARTAELATSVAGRIIGQTLRPEDHEGLVQDALDKLQEHTAGRN